MQPQDSLHIHDEAEATAARDAIRTVLCGSASLPTATGTPVAVASPVAGLPACTRLDLAGCGPAYVWLQPGADHLAIVHQGHLSTLEAIGVGDVIRDFWLAGYSVAGILMPGGGSAAAHNTGTIPLGNFVLPTIAAINYVVPVSAVMTGISGGGWTTHLAAAVDSRIVASVPTAGSLPLYFGNGSAGPRDWEQFLPGLSPYTYLDLYTLAALNGECRQLLFTLDPGCPFNVQFFRSAEDYRPLVSATSAALGGKFSLTWIDQSTHDYTLAARRVVFETLTGRPWPIAQIRDSHDASTQRVGPWTSWAAPGYVNPGRYGASEHTAAPSSDANYCQWNFNVNPGTYHVWATWSTHTNRATNAPYRILDGGVQVGEVRVNQEVAPADLNADGATWKYLGKWPITNTLAVRLGCDANEYLAADAVRVMVE